MYITVHCDIFPRITSLIVIKTIQSVTMSNKKERNNVLMTVYECVWVSTKLFRPGSVFFEASREVLPSNERRKSIRTLKAKALRTRVGNFSVCFRQRRGRQRGAAKKIRQQGVNLDALHGGNYNFRNKAQSGLFHRTRASPQSVSRATQ